MFSIKMPLSDLERVPWNLYEFYPLVNFTDLLLWQCLSECNHTLSARGKFSIMYMCKVLTASKREFILCERLSEKLLNFNEFCRMIFFVFLTNVLFYSSFTYLVSSLKPLLLRTFCIVRIEWAYEGWAEKIELCLQNQSFLCSCLRKF